MTNIELKKINKFNIIKKGILHPSYVFVSKHGRLGELKFTKWNNAIFKYGENTLQLRPKRILSRYYILEKNENIIGSSKMSFPGKIIVEMSYGKKFTYYLQRGLPQEYLLKADDDTEMIICKSEKHTRNCTVYFKHTHISNIDETFLSFILFFYNWMNALDSG